MQMRFVVALAITLLSSSLFGKERTITKAELLDRATAFWQGQLVGNYMGFPFEGVFVDEPAPIFIDRIYTWKDADKIRLNAEDRRSFTPIVAEMFEGAFADDDTDIEFVTLHAVEKYGLDITYPEIAEMWKSHINRKIWVANRRARDLMDTGLTPPDTGRRENNRDWFQIDPQLVNEIWSAFYPGMVKRAVARADWAARITSDDWGVHPTLAYAAMYSAAFFVDDVDKLVAMAYREIPHEGPFFEGMTDVIRWHQENPDWRDTRKLIHEKYYRYRKDGYEAPVSVVSSLVNGLCGVMAILYGEGNFLKTTAIAVTAGYDCDNQAATSAGLIATMRGTGCIPGPLTRELSSRGKWDKPFNDRYINWTRDGLPIDNRISDIAARIVAIAEKAILENGGRITEIDGQPAYVVQCDF